MNWRDVEYKPYSSDAPELLAVRDALRATHVNGGAILQLYRPVDEMAFDAAAKSDRRGQENMVRCFLEAPSVRSTVPELRIPTSLPQVPKFDQYRGFEFEGAVTHLLLAGGAYKNSHLDEETARQMSRNFVDALLGKGRLRASVWGTTAPWTDWFYDVAWDQTFIAFQPVIRRWALFCVTDTD